MGERGITRAKERTESLCLLFRSRLSRSLCVCVCKCVHVCVCVREREREGEREKEKGRERERERERVCVCLRTQKRALDYSAYSVRVSTHEIDIARVKENIKSLCV